MSVLGGPQEVATLVCMVCGRYTLYVESKAYVSNLRQKMATGALVLAVCKMHEIHHGLRLRSATNFILPLAMPVTSLKCHSRQPARGCNVPASVGRGPHSCAIRHALLHVSSGSRQSAVLQAQVADRCSTLVQVRMHYYEWWSRALKPGVHFVEVEEGDAMCDDIVRKVRLWATLTKTATVTLMLTARA